MAERLALPDCKAERDYFALTAAEKRELVLRIAKDGPDAIDAFIREREAAGDSTIAARIKRLREELVRRAEELRERLAGGFSERARAEEARYQAAFAALASEREAAAARLRDMESSESRFLEEALRGSHVVNLILSAPPPEAMPFGARVRRFLLRLLSVLLWPIRALLRLFFGRKSAKREKRVTMGVPIGGRLGIEVEARVGSAFLANPEMRRRVKERLRASPARDRLRRAWERLLGREDYESIAQRIAAEMIEEEAAVKRGEIRERETALSREMSRLSEEEERRRAELAGRLSDLEREREMEAERLERELASAPEREVKEAILDELKGTGLVRERGGKLLPTLAFLDRFGALVYAEEARAGSRGGATGAYAEGQGTFTREPLRSQIEIAHMDTVASVTRARIRHPHVRHLTEDDVLVYREEREALQHVVIILDRSGSMEENGRLDAAKRAALALMHAVKQENPRNRVDFVSMSTSVERVDAMGVWEAEPRGFTNTGAALRLARDVLAESRSERGLVYLVTDGLPEAYTAPEKRPEDAPATWRAKYVDVAGHPAKARAFALEQARALKRVPGFGSFVCLLLEPEDAMFVKAAEELAEALDGRVVKLVPGELAGTLIREFERQPVAAR